MMMENEFQPKQSAQTITFSKEFFYPIKIKRTGFIEFIRVKLLRMQPRFIMFTSDYKTMENKIKQTNKAMQEMIDKPLYK